MVYLNDMTSFLLSYISLDIGIENFVVAGEMLHVAEAFIDKNYHPTVICRGNFMIEGLGNSYYLWTVVHYSYLYLACFI